MQRSIQQPTSGGVRKDYADKLRLAWLASRLLPSKPMEPEGHSADQPVQPAEMHCAWGILLQCPAITQDTQVLCSLLSCSKTICAAIPAGSIDLQYVLSAGPESEQAHQFSAWLARNSCKLRQLQPDSSKWIRRYGKLIAETKIKAGLEAAAAKEPLQLQVYESAIDGASNGDILQWLPPEYLRHLCLQLHPDNSTDISRCRASLSKLKNLSSLSLAETIRTGEVSSSQGTESDCSFVDQLLPAVASLKHLTYLSISTPKTAVAFSYLPVQLEKLALTARYDFGDKSSPPPAMDVQHLTALTRLKCFHALNEADRLPHQLEILDLPLANPEVLGCAKPLLGLEKLRILKY